METDHHGESPSAPSIDSNINTILPVSCLDNDPRLVYLEEPHIFQAEEVNDFKHPVCVEIKPLQLLKEEKEHRYKYKTTQRSPVYRTKSEKPFDSQVYNLKRSMPPEECDGEKRKIRILDVKLEPASSSGINLHTDPMNSTMPFSNGEHPRPEIFAKVAQSGGAAGPAMYAAIPLSASVPPFQQPVEAVYSANHGTPPPPTESRRNEVEVTPVADVGQPFLNVDSVTGNNLASVPTATPYPSQKHQPDGRQDSVQVDTVAILATDGAGDDIAMDVEEPSSIIVSPDVSAADTSEALPAADPSVRVQSKPASGKRNFESAFQEQPQAILSSPSTTNDIHDVQEDVETVTSTVANPRPEKARRVVLCAVELPTAASILGTRQVVLKYDKEESEKMLKHLKKPEVKKKEGYTLSADTVRARLQPIGLNIFPIPLEKSIVDFTAAREMISDHYGGNRRSTFPTISEKNVKKHGPNDFMFPNPLYNPHVPEIPGAPGLWYTVKQNWPLERINRWKLEHRVVTLLKTGIWQYQGQYVLRSTSSLTKEEWAAQDQKVRNTWAENIHEKKWGRPTRARIALRARLRRAPTDAELNAALDTTGNFKEVLPSDISRALLRGEEVMAVWTMKCVRYDMEFQLGLMEKNKTWVPKPKRQAKGGSQKRKMVATTAQSRKRCAVESDDEGSSSDDSVEESSEEAKPSTRPRRSARVYTPRGTRSRPIVM